MNSKKYRLNRKDFFKGLVITFFFTILATIQTSIEAEGIPTTLDKWLKILMFGCLAFLSYVIKNFFTDAEGKIYKKKTEKNA